MGRMHQFPAIRFSGQAHYNRTHLDTSSAYKVILMNVLEWVVPAKYLPHKKVTAIFDAYLPWGQFSKLPFESLSPLSQGGPPDQFLAVSKCNVDE